MAEARSTRYVVRGGDDAVTAIMTADGQGVKIIYGRDGINATIDLDWGEARELAEVILLDFAERAELTS